jgi:hypothetical protein
VAVGVATAVVMAGAASEEEQVAWAVSAVVGKGTVAASGVVAKEEGAKGLGAKVEEGWVEGAKEAVAVEVATAVVMAGAASEEEQVAWVEVACTRHYLPQRAGCALCSQLWSSSPDTSRQQSLAGCRRRTAHRWRPAHQ